VKAVEQVDIVISAVGSQQIADQVKIIAAIKEAGNIKASHLAKQLFNIFLQVLFFFFPLVLDYNC
jgi:chemotaxis protein CheY-P-specific phosphatase CheC